MFRNFEGRDRYPTVVGVPSSFSHGVIAAAGFPLHRRRRRPHHPSFSSPRLHPPRDFSSYLSLGNKKHIRGQSLSSRGLRAFKLIILAEDANVSNALVESARACILGSLDSKKVKGKIIVCVRSGDIVRLLDGMKVLDTSGARMVLINTKAFGDDLYADPYFLPAVHILYSNSIVVFSYSTQPSHYIVSLLSQGLKLS